MSKATKTAAAEPVEAVKAVPKFTVDNLAKHSRELFGVSSCTFAGATNGLTGSYTIDEMKDIIEKWCNKPIGK